MNKADQHTGRDTWRSRSGYGYCRTQRGRFHHLLYAIGVVLLGAAWPLRHDPAALWTMPIVAAVLWLVAAAFHYMTVEDEVDCLAIRFGPLPLLHKRIRYDDITGIEPGQTTLLDGWGIHYVPGRGWTYNIWGFGCAKLNLGNRVIRIGTDDVEGLVEFLRIRTGRGIKDER